MPNVITPAATLSFPALFKPQPNKLDPSKPAQYSAMLTIPKTADISGLVAEMQRVAHEKFGQTLPHKFNWAIRDGDVMAAEKQDPWYAGKWVINAKANADYPPQVVGVDRQPIINREEIYAGCQVVAAINFFAYDQQVNKGVSAGLTAIMKIGDGERLDNRPNAQSLFAGVQLPPVAASFGGGAAQPQVNFGAAQGGMPAQQVPNFGGAAAGGAPAGGFGAQPMGNNNVPNFG